MNAAPHDISGARAICFAEVTCAVSPTGATTHRVAGQVLPAVRRLAICQYAGDSGFYLFYCDEQWEPLTDTFHVSLSEAKRQAEFEYAGISSHWRDAA
jgi:hypothetical protein